MAKQTINVGTTANDKQGDSLRAAFQKVNANFTELYTALGLNSDGTLNLGAFEFTGSTMSTTDSTAITIDQAVTVSSNLNVGGDILPNVANGGNLGSLTRPFNSLYVSTNTIYFGGVPLSLGANNTLLINNAPIDVADLTDSEELLGGGGAGPVQPYLELTDSALIIQPARLVNPVTFTRTANGSQTDAIAPGLTIARGSIRGIYNIASEEEWDNNDRISPQGTEWNSEGWGDLLNLHSRTYTTFYQALNQAIGENIIGAELVMHDTINDRYYKFSFSNWGEDNGGSFAYTRTLVEDPNYFKKADYATANNIDVIEDDSTLQIGITRGNNEGIYNPFTEEGWDQDVSPQGTQWNIDGWDDLTDIETRTYTNFDNAYGGQGIGNKIAGSKTIMYVPSIDKYYAVQWLSWTQNANGGGFSYLRYEIDLDKLDEGIRFPDGTVQKTAYIPTNVKLTAQGERRIEEVSGYKVVLVTQRVTVDGETTGGDPVVWWNKNELPGGGGNFRGAVIDYHAYTGDATIIGTIHIVDDDGEENITHTEVSSGSTDSENDDLWFVVNNGEGTISYRRIDGDAHTLKIQWTARVFYGSETND